MESPREQSRDAVLDVVDVTREILESYAISLAPGSDLEIDRWNRPQQPQSNQLAETTLELVSLDSAVIELWNHESHSRMRKRGSGGTDVE